MSEPTLRRAGALLREVAVIVAGVTLALGADALYDRSRDRAERERILRSLDADLRLDSAAYGTAVGRSLAVAMNATNDLLAVIDDVRRDPTRIELATAVRESLVFPAGLKEASTYREITATGGIGLIDDPTLREALLKYYARSFTGLPSEMWGVYLSDVHGPYERALRAQMGAAFVALARCNVGGAEYEACLRAPAERLDLARLRADADFIERLVGMALWAGRFEVYVGFEAAEHRALAERVRAEIGDS